MGMDAYNDAAKKERLRQLLLSCAERGRAIRQVWFLHTLHCGWGPSPRRYERMRRFVHDASPDSEVFLQAVVYFEDLNED